MSNSKLVLQLGHAGEGVEIALSLASRRGPLETLQLGHAGEGVEILSPVFQPAEHIGFNWATPVKAWRSVHDVGRHLAYGGLQLGHAGEGVEILQKSSNRLPNRW